MSCILYQLPIVLIIFPVDHAIPIWASVEATSFRRNESEVVDSVWNILISFLFSWMCSVHLLYIGPMSYTHHRTNSTCKERDGRKKSNSIPSTPHHKNGSGPIIRKGDVLSKCKSNDYQTYCIFRDKTHVMELDLVCLLFPSEIPQLFLFMIQ